MISSGLAIVGSTVETQKIFMLVKDKQFALSCKAVAKIDSSIPFYFLNQMHITDHDLHMPAKLITGEETSVESVEAYYQYALPRSAFTFMAYSQLFQKKWTSLLITKHLSLQRKDVFSYEVLRILQSLRTFISTPIEDLQLQKLSTIDEKKNLLWRLKVGDLSVIILLLIDPQVKETWRFTDSKTIFEIDPILASYQETTLLVEEGPTHYSFHTATQPLDLRRIWQNISEFSQRSLQNLNPGDWELVNYV